MSVLHDFRCPVCNKVFERMVEWFQESTPCACGQSATRTFLSRREYRAQAFEPVLIYKDSAGHYRFPGRNQGETPKGYEPVYLKTTADVRRFEKQINESERQRYFSHKERTEAKFQEYIQESRAELRQRMRKMSAYGRELAEAAIRQNDNCSSVDTRFDPQFHLNAFSFDSGNRDAHYDRDLSKRK